MSGIMLCIFPHISVVSALFTRWSSPNQKVFNITGLSPDMMQLIIEFAYTGSVSVTEGNARELMMAADQFNAMGVVQACSDFFVERLCPENCVGLWQFTSTCFSAELQFKAFRYIIDHFTEAVSYKEFLRLSVQELIDILARDDLNVKMESTVYEAVVRWIRHVPEERELHTTALLSKVVLSLPSD